MKLDVNDNLKNLEVYFRDVLGYKTYRTPNDVSKFYYLSNVKEDYLVMEITSVEQMIKYLDLKYECEGDKFPREKYLSGELPIPEVMYKRFGTHPEAPHFPPMIMVGVFIPETHENFTRSGYKQVYYVSMYGDAGLINEPILNYFLYCYDRRDSRFKAIPKKTVKEIENYLKSHGMQIYDSL